MTFSERWRRAVCAAGRCRVENELCRVLRLQVLCIRGFLAARKHHERIVCLVRIMGRSGFPCFKGSSERAVRALEKRLHLGATEVACVQLVLELISTSLDAWRTRQYDYYQRVLNGIL